MSYKNKPLSRKELFGLALPSALGGAWAYPVESLLPAYLGETQGMVLAGSAIMFIRLTDVLTDPVVGWWSDNSNSRWGQRKPFMMAGVIMMVTALLLLLSETVHSSSLFIVLATMGLYLASTFISTPHDAWVAEYSSDYTERTRINSWKTLVALVGVLVIVGIGIYVDKTYSGDSWMRISILLAALIVIAPVFVIASFYLVKEPEKQPDLYESTPDSPLSLMGLLREPAFLRLFIHNFLYNYGRRFRDAVMVFFVGSILLLPELISTLYLTTIMGTFLGVIACNHLSKKIEKHRLMCFVLLAMAAVSPLALFLPKEEAWPLMTLMFVIGTLGIIPTVLMGSMTADVIDDDYLRHGRKRAGSISAVMELSDKIAEGLGIGMVFLGLAALGFDPRPEAESTNLEAVTLVFSFGTVPFMILCAAVMWRYPLTRSHMETIQSSIIKQQSQTDCSSEQNVNTTEHPLSAGSQ
ncbi:MFS transporter [Endozoicomonas arenosclerae]|uniref:MFS transporter n=1 Tax=Endozoicomonas arenosclerae TaxID=1633495 RepID=UPI00078593D9|nr:MFS transporter [Endozoicomonas arenosclerae]